MEDIKLFIHPKVGVQYKIVIATGRDIHPVHNVYGETVEGAEFTRDQTQVLTWNSNGKGRAWSKSVDNLSPRGVRTLEWEVRSGTIVDSSGKFRFHSYSDFFVKKNKVRRKTGKGRLIDPAQANENKE